MNESKDEEDSRSHPPFFKTEVEHSSSGKAPVLEESALKSTIRIANLIFNFTPDPCCCELLFSVV